MPLRPDTQVNNQLLPILTCLVQTKFLETLFSHHSACCIARNKSAPHRGKSRQIELRGLPLSRNLSTSSTNKVNLSKRIIFSITSGSGQTLIIILSFFYFLSVIEASYCWLSWMMEEIMLYKWKIYLKSLQGKAGVRTLCTHSPTSAITYWTTLWNILFGLCLR